MFKSLLSLLLASTLSLGSVAPATNFSTFDDSSLLSVAPIPSQRAEYVAPAEVSARAAISVDLGSQTIMFQKNPDLKVPIASLTKLMTAYIILDEEDPNALVTVSANAAATQGSTMGLVSGETISVRNLLFGLLINSGNDAAVALAEYNTGSESNFVKKMNLKADALGLEQSQFSNSTGLDIGEAYSTPRDLALLSSYLLQDDTVREIVNLKSAEVQSVDGRVHQLQNTNTLLGEMGIKGLKTGKTPAAGECLISLAEGQNGHEILLVILGSSSRFNDTRVIVDWINRAFVW
jgi:D-alanyl-D-alanine carboxypeptidase (penicillin-binding protein 5/6)